MKAMKMAKDNEALIDRMNGRLTTIDILDHTFYVDFPMQMLRPKDNFASKGIRFDSIEDHFNSETERYEIPYNKVTNEFVVVDYDKITELPEDVALIGFPAPEIMDPVGYARERHADLESVLNEIPQRAHFTAKILRGKDDWLSRRIKENRMLLGMKSNSIRSRVKKI